MLRGVPTDPTYITRATPPVSRTRSFGAKEVSQIVTHLRGAGAVLPRERGVYEHLLRRRGDP